MNINYDFKPTFTLMTANLEPGESIKVEPGAMVAQSFDLSIKTGMGGGKGVGGFLKSMAKSMVGGESFWLNTFTAGSNGGWVSMAPSAPGDIETFDLAPGQNLFMQSGAFMACTSNVLTDTKFQGLKSVFSREGAFFLRAYVDGNSDGKIFYCAYGALKEIEVTPQNPIKVDNGHLVAFTDGISYSVAPSGGVKTSFFGGEGLVLELSGSGKVWIQTRNLEALANRIIPFLPQQRSQ